MTMEFGVNSLDWDGIINKYDTFFVDVVGVVYDGIKPFPKAIEALNKLENKKVIFVSNNPRPSSLSTSRLVSFGLKIPFHMVTSGDLARTYLQEDTESIYYHWGAQRNSDILANIPVKTTNDLNGSHKVLLTAFLEEEDDVTQFDSLIEEIVHKKLPVYCANPDKKAMFGSKMRICAGTFAEKIQKAGGEIYLWGKPETNIYSLAPLNESELHDRKSKCLMIGDTLETDILAANKLGIDSLLVLTGISALEHPNLGENRNFFNREIPKPTYILPYLG